MSPETGRRFGPYEIQGRLGVGGMGHVFRAWDARLHRDVAIKLLHNEFSMPGMRERFLREARAASALNHPNICTIFDIGEQDGDPYLVMELLEGETLKDRIQRSTIQIDELICVARECAEALATAHSKGIVHRDVKPANIFLVDKANGKTQTKVLDFGLAKIEHGALGSFGARTRSLDITSAGATVGTLAYMSPEQARGEVLDSRSDLFSLGVVLYEMATRQVPFPGATSALVFVKLLNHAPEPVREWNEAVPRDLEKIILKLLAKERTARYQTANELDQALLKLNEKATGGGWLRKAVATVPLVRAPDPVARERRLPKRRGSDSHIDPAGNSGTRAAADVPVVTPSSSSQAQVLRPVSRMPREDGMPRASASVAIPPLTPAAPATEPEAGTARERFNPEPPELFPEAEPVPVAQRPRPTPPPAEPRVAFAAEVLPVVVESSPSLPVPEEEMRQNGDMPLAAQVPVATRPSPRLRRNRRMRLGGVTAVLVVAACGVVLYLNRGHFGPTMLTERDAVVLTGINNTTGDKVLDGTVAQALQIALAQSPYLRLLSSDAFRSALRQIGAEPGETPNPVHARTAAQRLGAKAYLFGTISGNAAPYTLHMDLLSTSTNDVMASVDEHAASLQEIPVTLDRLSDAIRASAGEDADSINLSHNPIAREATDNLEALHAYAMGEDAALSGRTIEALGFYRQAAKLEPSFVQAQLRLVALYRKQRAEVAASDAAKLALTASESSNERTRSLAQYEYEMNASGDYLRATALIRHVLTANPHDSEGLSDLARVLRLQGRLAEALQTAQEAYAQDAYNLDAYVQAESALISLDRYDAALQVEDQVQRLGLARVGGSLSGGYLEGRQDTVDKAVADYESRKPGHRADWTFGLFMDNAGRLAEGLTLWRANAAAEAKIDGLESAAAFLLAQGALDRALVGDCGNALSLAHESAAKSQGVSALFDGGMTGALCGEPALAQQAANTLQRQYPQSTDVNDYLLADLKAALALRANDPAAALEILRPARQFDLISLTPFLRGRAHVALRQVQIGIVDFQTVLSHRGITFMVGTDVYPMAEIGVARAFADTGDMGNSADAYRRFLELWKNADPTQPLLTEARVKSH